MNISNDAFQAKSTTGSNKYRLQERHTRLIDRQAHLLKDKHVLDLASHDGRWSFSAINAGAASVTGIEILPDLVEASNENSKLFSCSDKVSFICADLIEGIQQLEHKTFDTVLCYGIFYHITNHVELLEAIKRYINPTTAVIFDTVCYTKDGNDSLSVAYWREPFELQGCAHVSQTKCSFEQNCKSCESLNLNTIDTQVCHAPGSNSYEHTYPDICNAGAPSPAALEHMCKSVFQKCHFVYQEYHSLKSFEFMEDYALRDTWATVGSRFTIAVIL